MKREDIKKLIPDITDETLKAIMDANGDDIEAAKKPFADYEDIKKQLGDANATINGFKSMDIDGIKKAADEWKIKAETAEKEAAAKIADMQFDGLFNAAVTAAKGKNAKAIRALIDADALKASKNQEADMTTAFETLKKDNGYLFETDRQLPPMGAPGAGSSQQQSYQTTPEINAIRAAAGLKTQ
jgi:hypothetical protein